MTQVKFDSFVMRVITVSFFFFSFCFLVERGSYLRKKIFPHIWTFHKIQQSWLYALIGTRSTTVDWQLRIILKNLIGETHFWRKYNTINDFDPVEEKITFLGTVLIQQPIFPNFFCQGNASSRLEKYLWSTASSWDSVTSIKLL